MAQNFEVLSLPYMVMIMFDTNRDLYQVIGLENGLAPNRQQAIIWSNVVMLYWRTYVSLSLNKLNTYLLEMNLCTHACLLYVCTCIYIYG